MWLLAHQVGTTARWASLAPATMPTPRKNVKHIQLDMLAGAGSNCTTGSAGAGGMSELAGRGHRGQDARW